MIDLQAEAERAKAWGVWLEAFISDPESETWARPCPACGSHVTDPMRHLRRAHGNTFELETELQ